MISKIARWLAIPFVAVLLAAGFGTTPAQAETIGSNCSEEGSASGLGRICLYDPTQYGTYLFNFYDIGYVINAGCLDLGSFTNVVSSLAINPTASGKNQVGSDSLRFYMNDNCTGTPVPAFRLNTEHADPDLTNGGGGTTINWSNAANSMRIS